MVSKYLTECTLCGRISYHPPKEVAVSPRTKDNLKAIGQIGGVMALMWAYSVVCHAFNL